MASETRPTGRRPRRNVKNASTGKNTRAARGWAGQAPVRATRPQQSETRRQTATGQWGETGRRRSLIAGAPDAERRGGRAIVPAIAALPGLQLKHAKGQRGLPTGDRQLGRRRHLGQKVSAKSPAPPEVLPPSPRRAGWSRRWTGARRCPLAGAASMIRARGPAIRPGQGPRTAESGRGDRIRTYGLRYPKPSRYQTAPRPDARASRPRRRAGKGLTDRARRRGRREPTGAASRSPASGAGSRPCRR